MPVAHANPCFFCLFACLFVHFPFFFFNGMGFSVFSFHNEVQKSVIGDLGKIVT